MFKTATVVVVLLSTAKAVFVSSFLAPQQSPRFVVSVFSARSNVERRESVRNNWAEAKFLPGYAKLNFVICSASTDLLTENLLREADAHGDIQLMDCTEGNGRKQLTRKLILSLEAFAANYDNVRTAFIKIEDDTFVPWHRLRTFLRETPKVTTSYMGVLHDAGHPVNRNTESLWYQPPEDYPEEHYPAYMARHGYVLGGELVRLIVQDGIAKSNVLSNEDQALGVWVDKVAQSKKAEVAFVNLAFGQGNIKEDAAYQGNWTNYPYLFDHGLKPDFSICLARVDAQPELHKGQVQTCSANSMFLVVFSAWGNTERRDASRTMMKQANPVPGRFVAKFALCRGSGESQRKLEEEADKHSDLLFLDCQEGYTRTLLTLKLLAAMSAYAKNYSQYSLFMKVDDDTFIHWKRLRSQIATLDDADSAYIGLLGGPEGMAVNRNESDVWYQPRDTYPNDTLPRYMEGGTGYMLGRGLVTRILNEGIAESNMLSNEDQAMGVWVDVLRQRGSQVNFLDLPGTDGYRPQFDVCFGKWKDYPYVLHHHLDPSTISCLAEVSRLDNEEYGFDGCFSSCSDSTAQFLAHKLHAMSTETQETVSILEATSKSLDSMYKKMVWLHDSTVDQRDHTPYPEVAASVMNRTEELALETRRTISRLTDASRELMKEYEDAANNQSQEQPPLKAQLLQGKSHVVRGRSNEPFAPEEKEHQKKAPDATDVIFVHIPKNAGTAIEEAGASVGVWWPRKWLSFWHGLQMPDGSLCEKYHVPPSHLQSIQDDDWKVFNGKDTFCVTRSPFQRIVSEYRYMLSVSWGSSMSQLYQTGLYDEEPCTEAGLNHFAMQALSRVKEGRKYVHDCHLVPQTEFIWGEDGHQWCRHILRSSDLPGAFNTLMEDTDLKARLLNYRENNTTEKCPGLSVASLSPEVAKLIREIYSEDFLRLGYDPDEVDDYTPVGQNAAALEAAKKEAAVKDVTAQKAAAPEAAAQEGAANEPTATEAASEAVSQAPTA
mmetsp:Transcript_54246/g.117291  ORF Transcript_54246/g.117291 Transcript_54246/m.117291 type:complete len:998 (-) Transcript_54246:94-3087(-)